jgi:hypothetical protein
MTTGFRERRCPYAAELLLEAEDPVDDDEDDDDEDEDDEVDEDEVESDEGFVSDEGVEALGDDGLLLDDEPRLSFR